LQTFKHASGVGGEIIRCEIVRNVFERTSDVRGNDVKDLCGRRGVKLNL